MTHVSTCPLCEAVCGILVEVDGHRVTSVRGDPDDPFSQGYICPKASALIDLHHDPDRLRTPLVREGSHWRQTGWDEALARAADGLRRVRRRHGRDAVAVYYGNPVAHNLGLMTHGLAFGHALRTRNTYSASSTDQLPQMVTAFRMFGHLGLIPVPDVDRTELFLVVGANPVVSNGSLMTAPGMPRRLRALVARGGRLVVVDPRRTETAALADTHIAIRPGTDTLWLAALLHVVFAQDLVRPGRLAGRVRHVDRLAALVSGFSPERVAGRTGVAPDVTRQLAVDFARAPRAAAYGRVGLCTQRDGTLATWLLQALNIATGRVDEAGGMMLPTPAVDGLDLLARLGRRGTFGRWHSRVRRLPEFSGELPLATLPDEIETPGPGRIRALLTMAGNPVLSGPHGRRLDEALATLEHVVAIDPYLNETTRHADVVLPPASPLSRTHYDLALYAFAVRNVAKLSEPVVQRAPTERHDWEIVSELAGRVLAPGALGRLAGRLGRLVRPEQLVDLLLRLGPHPLTLQRLRNAPHGLDLGPLRPGEIVRRLASADGRVDLAPADLVDEAHDRLRREIDRSPGDELLLIGRRQLRSHNSWMHNAPRLMKGADRCTLLMHPDDARSRGLTNGDAVRLDSGTGSVVVPLVLSDEMRPGVVSLPHGWGHDRGGVELNVARRRPGVSVNDVTRGDHLDGVSGNAAFNGLPVRVTSS